MERSCVGALVSDFEKNFPISLANRKALGPYLMKVESRPMAAWMDEREAVSSAVW